MKRKPFAKDREEEDNRTGSLMTFGIALLVQDHLPPELLLYIRNVTNPLLVEILLAGLQLAAKCDPNGHTYSAHSVYPGWAPSFCYLFKQPVFASVLADTSWACTTAVVLDKIYLWPNFLRTGDCNDYPNLVRSLIPKSSFWLFFNLVRHSLWFGGGLFQTSLSS